MGAKYGAATSLRSCCVVLGDQDGWGTNRLSKAESILGTGMSQNLSRGRRHAWMIYLEDQPDTVHPHGCGEHASGKRFIFSSFRFIPTGVGNTGIYSRTCCCFSVHPHGCGEHLRCQPWRAKRRLVVPSSREAALFSRRALRQRENKVGLRTRRPVIGSQVRSSNELAKLLRSAW